MSTVISGAKVPSKQRTERKVALLLRIQPRLKDGLTELAKREHRSLNRQIEFLLDQALSDAVKEKHGDQLERTGTNGKS